MNTANEIKIVTLKSKIAIGIKDLARGNFQTYDDAEQLVEDTVARMLENQARFIVGVQRGIEQADRGELVEHQDVLNRIDRLFLP